jgi:putative phosphoribosyl transferase
VSPMTKSNGGRAADVFVGPERLPGGLTVPDAAYGAVVFAHGSGSSRLSPRNRLVASGLNDEGLATLLFDLLTAEEETGDLRTAELRFDIGLLGRRLTEAVDWLAARPEVRGLPFGAFGASTGAAAAIVTAADRPDLIRAVVSRGGRPDLAGPALEALRAPTLLIVGGADDVVIRLNEEALRRIPVEARVEIVPGATHLFEEPGALERVAELAREWFERHLRMRTDQSP